MYALSIPVPNSYGLIPHLQIEGFINDDAMGCPVISESMAYRLTEGQCTNKEAVEWYQDSYAAGGGTYADASNEWSWVTGGGPPCTRTAYQMTKLESDPNEKYSTTAHRHHGQ